MAAYIITALVIVIAMFFLLKALWKTAKILVIPIQIILFGILCFACFKIFFSKENVTQVNAAIEKSGIVEMNKEVLEKGGQAITKAISGNSSNISETDSVKSSETADSLPENADADLPGTKIFRTRNPKDPTEVKIIPENGKLRVICSFKGQTAFSPDKNAKINASKAEKLCTRGLFRFVKVQDGQRLEISNLAFISKKNENGLEIWNFKIPADSVKAVSDSTEDEEEDVAAETSSTTAAKESALEKKNTVQKNLKEKTEKNKSDEDSFFKMDTDSVF